MRSTSVICSSAKPPQMRKWKLSFGEPDFWYLILMPWVKWERNEKGNDNQQKTNDILIGYIKMPPIFAVEIDVFIEFYLLPPLILIVVGGVY